VVVVSDQKLRPLHIVLIIDSKEVDELKHEQEALRQQLRYIKQANRDMKSAAKAALRGMAV